MTIFPSFTSYSQIDQIDLDQRTIETEIAQREVALARPMIEAEKDEMVKTLVFDEFLLNEAIKLNLHKTDHEVRERFVAIMELAFKPKIPKPGQSDLFTYFDDHREEFYEPTRYSCNHLYFEYKPHLDLNELSQTVIWQSLGNDYCVKHIIESKPAFEIAAFLGP